MTGPRIVGMNGSRQPTESERKMIQYKGLANLWSQYADLMRQSDIPDRDKKAAEAAASAAGYIRLVIDSAENQMRRMEVYDDADKKLPD